MYIYIVFEDQICAVSPEIDTATHCNTLPLRYVMILKYMIFICNI